MAMSPGVSKEHVSYRSYVDSSFTLKILDQENSSRRAAPLDLGTVYSSPNESDDTLASLPARDPGAEFEDSSVVSEIGVPFDPCLGPLIFYRMISSATILGTHTCPPPLMI